MRIALALLLTVLLQLAHSRVLGVPDSKQALYKGTNGKFRCLDGSAEISLSSVNDDYCDCRDGSDEPGTSACPQTLFTCQNAEYLPIEIPASWVGDGLCDCCDGSDEKKVVCHNTCAQKGASVRAEALKQHTSQAEGWQKRGEYVKAALEETQQRFKTISELKAKLAALELELQQLLEAKEKAEEAEKMAIERQRQKDQVPLSRKVELFCNDFQANVKALNDEMTRLRDLLVALRDGADQSQVATLSTALSQADVVLAKIPSVPSLCSNLELEVCSSPSCGSAQASDQHHHDHADHDHGHDHDHEDYHLEDDDHYHEGELPDDDLPVGQAQADNHDVVGEEITAAVKARDDYITKENEVKEVKSKLHNLEKIQDLDLGHQGEYIRIYEKCYEYNNPEYTYEFCPYVSSTQKPKRGGSHTSLGTFLRWSGPEDNRYSIMRFDNGLKCWGGPNRSTDVKFICGDKEELLSVEEPAKCEYLMVFSTPLACGEPKSVEELFREAATRKKDEL